MAPAPQSMGGEMPDFHTHPLVPSPTGTSNFVDPVTRAPMATAIATVVLVLAFIATCLRFYARRCILGNVGVDDWVGLAAMIVTAEYTIYAIVLFNLPGMGPHMWDIPGIVFFDNAYGLRLLFTEIMYCPAAYLIKLSIFLLYRRVFISPGGRAKAFIMGGIYISTVMYVIMFVLSWAFCTKSASVVDGGGCHQKGAYVGWALATVNIVTDIYLLAIPPFVIVKLQITSQRKFAISLLFFFTASATISSIFSVYYRVYVGNNSMDFSWNIVPAAVATITELNLGIVCSSLPAVNILFHKARIQARNNYATFGTSGNATKPSLLSRVSNKMRSSESNMSDDHDTRGHQGTFQSDHDIVRLIDIQQSSEPLQKHASSLERPLPTKS
ncbi:hypothetical protein DM02DRAFT_701104 [Periconia macrospinosa]|uniref:Rhodopsin domain-containing protein n=1 Tax=Periconia macrospinosa TaxID=97972 RepID=A0A2V1E0F0_9PLEO|nr:hypothetical protein DM02DRAFT_701104 [Periconia macrospinosa]